MKREHHKAEWVKQARRLGQEVEIAMISPYISNCDCSSCTSLSASNGVRKQFQRRVSERRSRVHGEATEVKPEIDTLMVMWREMERI